MFFRKMTSKENDATTKAVYYGFTFFLIALLANSIYSYLTTEQLSSSFIILLCGLLVFFGSSFVFAKLHKKD